MKNSNHKHIKKAYDDKSFLHSRGGRILRIASEYLYPEQQLKKMGIKRTVIFFGSARISSPEIVQKKIDKLLKKSNNLLDEEKNTTDIELRRLKKQLALSVYYSDAQKIAYELTKWSQMQPKSEQIHIGSGGGPGIMEAANRGANEAGGMTIGLNISLPFEQESNPYIHPDLNFEFHYFFMRKFWFVYLSQVMIVFPGGFGTIDEMMEIMTLKQTKKMRKPRLIILYSENWWKNVINFDFLVENEVISKSDLELFRFVNTPEEVIELTINDLKVNKIKNRF
jgi:hypothetical protein